MWVKVFSYLQNGQTEFKLHIRKGGYSNTDTKELEDLCRLYGSFVSLVVKDRTPY